MVSKEQAQTLAAAKGNVLTSAGDKVGGIGQIYVDDTTGDPTWVTVKTGLFGTSESFVPLQGADIDGDDVRVGYDKDTIKDAPRVDADGNISPEEEDRLYSYYGLGGGGVGDGFSDRDGDSSGYRDVSTAGTAGVGVVDGTRSDDYDGDASVEGRRTVGHDTSGPTTDDAMTRSEERLNVGTQKRESGRARLRKYVVTENVTHTVPVSREEVRIEREPITDANRGAAESGPAISDEEHEVVLHEERPVVEKEAVPVERVRLDKETVTDHATVSEDVRKEQIDMDGDHTR
ncbi:MAG TPA: PRC and DUF2382 domain-containing protein [Propionibacteriaceae bacterium]|nr:PRC and DUF2382 domain-containing protein [Propionibacteriaceae bacterium]